MSRSRLATLRFAFTSLVVAVVVVIVFAAPVFGQTAKQLQERRKREIEAKKRAFEYRNRKSSQASASRSTTSRAGASATSRFGGGTSTSSKVTEDLPDLRYKMPAKTTLPYLFIMTSKGRGVTTHTGGIAVFEVVKHDRSSIHLKATDNLRLSFDASSMPARPTRSTMVPAELHLDSDGFSPKVDGRLPHMMGVPHKWFFPHLPDEHDQRAGGGYTAQKGFAAGGRKDTGNGNRAYFSWEVKLENRRGSKATFTDTRFFETEDGAKQHLKGQGRIVFDEKRGVVSRDFSAKFRHFDATYDINLKIRLLSGSQYKQLASK